MVFTTEVFPPEVFAAEFFGGEVTVVTVPTSDYTTYDEFIRRWGLKNVAYASNKDNDSKEVDLENVQDALDYAVDEIHAMFQGSILSVPFVFTTGRIPRQLKEWVHVIAFEHLYNSRGFDDKNTKINRLTSLLQRVYYDMGLYKSGIKQFADATTSEFGLDPGTIGDDDDTDTSGVTVVWIPDP